MTDGFFSWLVRIRTKFCPLGPRPGGPPKPTNQANNPCALCISMFLLKFIHGQWSVFHHISLFVHFFPWFLPKRNHLPIPPPLPPRIPWVPAPGFQWIAMSSIPQHLRAAAGSAERSAFQWDQWKGLGMSGAFWDTSFGLRWCLIIFVCLHVIDIDDSCDLRVPRLYCETSINQWDFNSIWFTLVLKTPVINTTTKPTSNFGWFIRPISGKSWWIITLGWPHCIETHWTEGWLKFNVVTFDPSIWFV